jgi:hypothetical protein
LSRILVVEPHLSELKVCGHIVTAGNDTSSIEWANVSTIVMIGTLVHAINEEGKKMYTGTLLIFSLY